MDHHSLLYTIDRPLLGDDVRRVIVANALCVIDVEAGDPRTRSILEELLGPVVGRWDLDRPFRYDPITKRTQGVSTCGLVAEGLWRRAGVDAPWLSEEYGSRRYDSIERARVFAQRLTPHSAWHVPKDGQRPRLGDYLVIGEGLQTHALTVVGWDGDMLISVDGGQVGARGLQAIHKCTRPWLVRDRIMLGARPVIGWVVPEMLPGRSKCVVPEGWDSIRV